MPALEAVLADIKQAGVDEIICLGDVANVGPHPAECLDVIRDLGCVTLQGNHELYLLADGLPDDWQICPTWSPVRWTMAQLRPEHYKFMADLPFAYDLPANGRAPATFVHASLRDQYWGFAAEDTVAETAVRMNGRDNLTLFCAHTHRPLYRLWSNSIIINIGSVGMPLDGTPEAKYVIATRDKANWNVEFRHVSYNVEHVMQAFESQGLQAAGGVISGIFRYQMLTGKPTALSYITRLRQLAQERNVPVGDVYAEMSAPDCVRPFLDK
ncbi:MAG: metallophosphoesterase family protein [Chloroflexi bacterium]|nr:metallophosphoesterase family protein [Chloroflexota bacterium]